MEGWSSTTSTYRKRPLIHDLSLANLTCRQRPGPKNDPLYAFPPGFRMLAGNPYRRNYTGGNAENAVSFACLGANQPETHGFPNYKCPGGLRVQIYFPSCWDGKNLDSPDHMSHMAYPTGQHYDNGPCPTTHPVHLVSLFFEVLYDTSKFDSMWYGNSQPFVLSQGDKTGYGMHGDFVNGWDTKALQAVINQCTDNSVFGSIAKKDCPPIDLYTSSEMNSCKLPAQIDEPVRGYLEKLPGCNPVTSGPQAAVPVANCPVPKINDINTAAANYKDFTSQGWGYVGCASDVGSSRTFPAKTSVYTANVGKTMTLEWCMNFCKDNTFFGVQYGSE